MLFAKDPLTYLSSEGEGVLEELQIEEAETAGKEKRRKGGMQE